MSGMKRRIERDPGIEAAIEAAGGNISELCRSLGIIPSSLGNWRKVPAARAPEITRLWGVPLHVLRPDLFDPPSA